MADEQMNYESQDAAPKDTGAEEAYRSLESDDTATQPTQLNPTQVNPAAAHYVQQGAQSTYQAQGGVYGRQGYPQQYQQGQYGQAQYQQGQYQQAQGRPVNPYAQQLQQQQAYQQAQQQRAYQQAQQQAYQQSYVPQQSAAATPQKKDRSGLKSALFGLAGGAVGLILVSISRRLFNAVFKKIQTEKRNKRLRRTRYIAIMTSSQKPRLSVQMRKPTKSTSEEGKSTSLCLAKVLHLV